MTMTPRCIEFVFALNGALNVNAEPSRVVENADHDVRQFLFDARKRRDVDFCHFRRLVARCAQLVVSPRFVKFGNFIVEIVAGPFNERIFAVECAVSVPALFPRKSVNRIRNFIQCFHVSFL